MINKYSKNLFVFLWFTMIISPLYCQVKHTHDFVSGFVQLKEGLNLGMVFDGFQLEYRYGAHWNIKNHEICYQPAFGAAYVFQNGALKQLMDDVQIHFTPINVTWTMPLYDVSGHTFKGGLNFIADYNYQDYNDLHDDPLFWNSEIGFSPVIQYHFQWNDKRITVGLRNSLFGFTSHIQGYDPYFWQYTFKDVFIKPHTDLKFGSFNNYNHTNFSLEFVPNTAKRHSIGYEFDYLGLFYGNQFYRINHNLIWRISL